MKPSSARSFRFRRGPLTAAAAAALLVVAQPALAAAGDLDTRFGTNGFTITPFSAGNSVAWDLAVQPDDKLVAVGGTGTNFATVRYSAAGLPDTTFGSNGKVTTTFGALLDYARGVAIQPDGKVVVVGTADDNGAVAVARYTSYGDRDTTFSGNGKVKTALGFVGEDVAIQSDGKIVVMGTGNDPDRNGKVDFLAMRFAPTGQLDPTFSDDGVARVSFEPGGASDQAFAGAVDPAGRIVLAGTGGGGDGDFALARLLPDGRRDPNFGRNGKVTTDFGDSDYAFDVAIQSDGRIIVAGYTFRKAGLTRVFALARYRAGGHLDPSFSADGKLTTAFAKGASAAKSVTVDSNGNVVAAGTAGSFWALARYLPDGSLDPAFSADGRVVTHLTGGYDRAEAVATQSTGNIVAAGVADDDMAIARYFG